MIRESEGSFDRWQLLWSGFGCNSYMYKSCLKLFLLTIAPVLRKDWITLSLMWPCDLVITVITNYLPLTKCPNKSENSLQRCRTNYHASKEVGMNGNLNIWCVNQKHMSHWCIKVLLIYSHMRQLQFPWETIENSAVKGLINEFDTLFC